MGSEQNCDAAKIVPGPVGSSQQPPQIEYLEAGQGDGDQDGLNNGAAVADEPQKFFAVEWFLAKFRCACARYRRARIGRAKVPAEPLLRAPSASQTSSPPSHSIASTVMKLD